jgi:hypothetical protein
MAGESIEERIQRFRDGLRHSDATRMVRRYTLSTDPYAMDGDVYFELQAEVARHFGIHPSEVALVGSGQLGFSIVPKKRFRHFGNDSDIDLAIISPRLFEHVWKSAFDYWRANRWWPAETEFHKYLFRGWIRPDKLPPANRFQFCREWWEFFRELTRSGRFGSYSIKAGLYQGWHFLESYQVICVQSCIDEATTPVVEPTGSAAPLSENDS